MNSPMNLETKLSEIFETNKVEYHRQSFQNDNYVYFISCEKITPEINGKFSETFHNGSYYGIAKAVKQKHLNVTVDITISDFKEFFA